MNEDFEVLRGSGNVFLDLGHPNPDVEQLKALLPAAEIIKTLDKQRLTVRAGWTPAPSPSSYTSYPVPKQPKTPEPLPSSTIPAEA